MISAASDGPSTAAEPALLPLPEHVPVLIVGAGFAGLGMAIRLKQSGRHGFLVIERADDLGGTWRDNTYPGCACDVPSHLYSYSFAPNPDWSRSFSGQPEIRDYIRRVADAHQVRPHIRFGAELLGADWDPAACRWRVRTSRGELTAGALIAGLGPLSQPSVPALPGLDSFAGTAFHSATWDHQHELTGRKVAVIGTGASAIQFVPEIAGQVGQLTLFQRTAPWVMPRRDRSISRLEQLAYRRLPAAQRVVRESIYWGRELTVLGLTGRSRLLKLAEKQSLKMLARQVPDPALRERLTPRFAMGCKRILLSNSYYPALMRDNVELVTEPIEQVLPTGIRTRDGVLREADTIIFGTGFHVTDMAIGDLVRGSDGRSLAQSWEGSPKAYLGTTVAGFPNLFLLVGPNTGLGHNSIIYMIEAQLPYIEGALAVLREPGVAAVDVRPEVQDRFVAQTQAKMVGTVWTAGGCQSWYLDQTGRNSTLWPDFTFRYRRRLVRFDRDSYRVLTADPAPALVTA